ncbi:MAG: ferredoxin:thioredoxin reductase [Spirochaetales bacterium]|nr:ferredoxin:thioredoxin reductase [Spirochaetales bacterium]
MKSFDQTIRFITSVASHKGWSVNPDRTFLQTLASGLTSKENTYGYFLCPCREGWGEREKDRDIICPCAYAADDISEYGHCYCALYLNHDFAKSGREVQSIPERRDPELFP